MPIDAIKDDFAFLDDWEDRYRYVIELGKDLEQLPDDKHSAPYKVEGCVSQVWLDTQVFERDGQTHLKFVGDSDALIVRGLIAILIALYSERPAEEIRDTDAVPVLRELGLDEHLTPQRSNGLKAMVARMREDAARAAAAA